LEEKSTEQEQTINELEGWVKREAEKRMQLEEENMVLRSLLMEMKSNPNIKMLMMQTIEPISKALNSQFD
jgi:uncharacterized coiled-coil protein SlyX